MFICVVSILESVFVYFPVLLLNVIDIVVVPACAFCCQCCVLWLLCMSGHVLCLSFVWFYLFKQSAIRLPKVLLHLSSR